MIIVGGKNVGKKLVNKIIRELQKSKSVDLAVLSELGAHQIDTAGQKVSNKIGQRIQADPHKGEVTIDGVHRVALIVTFTRVTEEEIRKQEEEAKAAELAKKKEAEAEAKEKVVAVQKHEEAVDKHHVRKKHKGKRK